MKLTLLTLTLLLTALAQLTAQLPQSDSPIVRLIYFRPSDRPIQPDINTLMNSVIKDVQRFYAAQMEQHGYGRKTFQFEADANGNAVVHHVNGQFNDAYYQDALLSKVAQEIHAQVPSERDIYLVALDSSQEQYCGVASGSMAFMRAPGACVRPWVAAHELGHTFGLLHDARDRGHVMYFYQTFGVRFDISDCTAEWLDVHPAFNASHSAGNNEPATIEMLAPSLTSPNTVSLRFEVTDPDGLHQAQLLIGKGRNTEATLTTCKQFNGNPSGSLEFVTTGFPPQGNANLRVIDMQGNTSSRYFPIDITPLLPPAQVVTIPDANLAAAVREALELSVNEPITTHAMLLLTWFSAGNRGIKNLTGLEHAVNLKGVELTREYISGEGYVNSNAISDVSSLAALPQLTLLYLDGTAFSDVSALAAFPQLTFLYLRGTAVSDVSPLSALPQLTWLFLSGTAVSDVSPLAALTQLTWLDLRGTAVSDVSALAALTQLTLLDLRGTAVSDVSPLLGLNLTETFWDSIGLLRLQLTGCPLSYASLHTHIPALQAKGIEVEFHNVAHPALLKTSGDGQEGAGGAMLKTPFVVEAMDAHGKPLVGVPIQFEIRHGGGTLNANTVKTDARGKAQITLTLGRASGINKVKASSEGIQSWVLFTAVGTEDAPPLVADVNGDGSVNIQDLVLVAGQFGETGKNSADVNGDGVVNIQDLVLVASAFGEGAAAPSARAVSLSRLTASDVEGWLVEARAVSSVGGDRLILTSFSRQTHLLSDSGSGDPELQRGSASRPGGLSYLRGIAVLEQLLASLMPKATALLANYPNPFNPETWIPYQLANPAEVTVTIYAANGAVVRTLDLGHRRAGSYASRSRAAYWDGRNEQGEHVASGVYFYTLQAGEFSATRKMVIRK